MSFDDVDKEVRELLEPTYSRAESLVKRVRYIITVLGKERGIRFFRRRTEYKSGDFLLQERKPFITTRFFVYYKGELVMETDYGSTVYTFRDGPWVNELIPIYRKAKLKYLSAAFGIQGLGDENEIMEDE